MNIQTRLDKLEKARPAEKNHLVWREQGESPQEAVNRFKATHRTGQRDEFLTIGWTDAPEEVSRIEHGAA